MTTRLFPLFLAALCLVAGPAAAQWSLEQRPGFAAARTGAPGYTLELSCRRGQPLMLTLEAAGSDRDLVGVRGLMLWLTLPDGRTDRWSVEVTKRGNRLTGPLTVSAGRPGRRGPNPITPR